MVNFGFARGERGTIVVIFYGDQSVSAINHHIRLKESETTPLRFQQS